ncbi:MAG: alpha/beta hydrolase [Alphaproteobacteria bacterium]|nr:alpha/beta hydrolase [Alphaproteobacteria bacterium]
MTLNMHFVKIGSGAATPMLWAHGWGQDHRAMAALAQSFEQAAPQIAIDFPGFGASPLPSGPWTTEDYADHMAEFLKAQNIGKIIWIGHSFGGRVGVQIAARHPELVEKLILIAAAGLPRPRPLWQKLWMQAKVRAYKILKRLPLDKDKLAAWFGSRDYQNAGPLRPIFLNVIRENLAPQAAQIRCPTLLIYGENDSETPPAIGQHYTRLITGAQMVLLPGQDHYSVLGPGRHLTARHIKDFIRTKP